MAFPQVSFEVQDALLASSFALPAQNATVNATAIDLTVANPVLAGTHGDLVLSVPATTTATGQTQTFTIQDSADNSTFAAVAQLATLVLTGVSNATPATERRWRLPDSIRRYVRVSVTSSATATSQTGVTATLTLRT